MSTHQVNTAYIPISSVTPSSEKEYPTPPPTVMTTARNISAYVWYFACDR